MGFKIKDKGIPRQGQEITLDGSDIGKVSSGTLSPTLGVGVGMGYAPPTVSKPGASFEIKIRDRNVPAEVVKLPFYQRRSGEKVVVMGEEMGLRDFRLKYGGSESTMVHS